MFTTEIVNALINLLTIEEIRMVVFSFHPNKSPGLDGFSVNIYQYF